jgi:TonB family protein
MTLSRIDRRLGRHTFTALTAALLCLAPADPLHRAGVDSPSVVVSASPAQQTPVRPRTYRRGEPSGQPATNRVYTGVPGAISGSIEDQLGDLVSGAVVRLTDDAGETRTARTSSNATFEFTGLPPGSYSLDLNEPGFAPSHADIPLAEGQSLSRAVVLEIGVVEESIQVTPGGPQAGAVPMTELDRVLAARAAPVTPVGTTGKCASPGPCVTPARKVIDRQPQYPPEAVNLGTEGEVILQGRITRDGVVEDIKPVMAADDSLKESVLAAVRQWQYKPTLLNGVAVEAPLTISVQFSRTSDRR